MSLVQLPTWLMERTTPTIKELQTGADLERKQERRRVGGKKKPVVVSLKGKDTAEQAVFKKNKNS